MTQTSKAWKKFKFNELCKNISNRIDNPRKANTDCYVGLEHLDTEEPKILRHGSPYDVSKTKLLFQKDDILFGKRNWYLRRLAIADREGICSAHMLVLRYNPKNILRDFLQILMFSDNFYEKALSVSAGSMSPTIKWKDISNFEFLVPHKSDQEKIVDIIKTIDDAISNSQNLLEKFKIFQDLLMNKLLIEGIDHTEFKKVTLYPKYFSTKIPKNWNLVLLSDVISKIADRDHTTPTYVEEGIPIVSPTNIDDDMRLNTKKLKFISKSDHEKNIKKTDIRPNDIIFSRIGAALGKSFLVQKDFCDFSILHSLCQIRTNDEILPKYLLWFLRCNLIQKRIWVTVQSIGVPDLGLHEIGKLPIFLPPISEQKKISNNLFELDSHIEKLLMHLSKLKILRKSILNEILNERIKEE